LLLVVLIACGLAGSALQNRPQAAQVGTAIGAPAQDFTLTRIEVTGASRHTAADVIRMSGLAVGQRVSVPDLNRGIRTMSDSGSFADVRYRFATLGTEMTVTIEIREAIWDTPVIFDNFLSFTDAELTRVVRERVPTFDGKAPAAGGAPETIRRTLANLLRTRGVPGTVTYRRYETLDGTNRRHVFAVTPGPKICGVQITGATVVPARELLKRGSEAFSGDYSRMYIDEFAGQTLPQMYRQKGYWRATFTAAPAQTNADGCTGVTLTLHVDEGPAFVWDHAEWIGNTAIAGANLDAQLGLRSGDVADGQKLDAGLLAVHDAHAKLGYVTEAAVFEPVLDDAAKRASFRIHVTEGAQHHMGRLTIVGATPDQAKTITAQWRLKPGDVFDGSYPREFQSKVLSRYSRRPHRATLSATSDANHVIDVTITME
jgi:outer membrane protein assembly factor BamA